VTKALRAFRDQVAIVSALLRSESRHRDPPPPQSRRIVSGLRGGAAILIVSAFEAYLNDGVPEHLMGLAVDPPRVSFSKLPEPIRWRSITRSHELAERGKPYEKPRPDKTMRIARMRRSADLHVRGLLDPAAFGETMSNPGADQVRAIFSDLDYKDVFVAIRTPFRKRWGSAIAHDFIPTTLDAVVYRRNQVAHTGDTSGFSRKDLADGCRFIGALGEILEVELRDMVRRLRKTCR
jgi:HEPN superfamily RiboL-PSP-like protein